MFSYVSLNWRGRPLESLQVIIDLIGSTTTSTGLKIYARLDPGPIRPDRARAQRLGWLVLVLAQGTQHLRSARSAAAMLAGLGLRGARSQVLRG